MKVERAGVNAFNVDKFSQENLQALFHGYDSVIHLLGTTWGTKERFKKINVDISFNVLEASKKAGIQRLITPSGLGVSRYGEDKWATNNYFWSKKEIERLFLESGQDFVIFRPSYILGPSDEMIPNMVHNIMEKGEVNIVGTGEMPMQPIYIGDAVQGFLNAAAGKGPANTIYDMVGPKTITMNELVSIVSKSLNSALKKEIGFKKNYISVGRAPEILGMSPEDVAITQSDFLGDNSAMKEYLGIDLTPIEKAIDLAVKDSVTKLSIKD